jgi:hypothetical protein
LARRRFCSTPPVNNTAVGAHLLNNTIAEENTATGAFALLATPPVTTTAKGFGALYSNTGGA